MIGQGIGLRFLLPRALEELQKNPFAEGDFFEGDLLVAVAGVPTCKVPTDEKTKKQLTEICRLALNSTNPNLPAKGREQVEGLLDKISDG